MNIYIGHIQFQTILTFDNGMIEIMFAAQMSTLSRFAHICCEQAHSNDRVLTRILVQVDKATS